MTEYRVIARNLSVSELLNAAVALGILMVGALS